MRLEPFFIMALFILESVDLHGGICAAAPPLPSVNFEGGQVTSAVEEREDKAVVEKMKGAFDRRAQVRVYMAHTIKTLKPLTDLPDQGKTLSALIEIASDARSPHTLFGKHPSEKDYKNAALYMYFRQEAPMLIASFCDKRAGKFLLDRIQRSTPQNEDKELIAAAFKKMPPQAEWREDFLAYAHGGFKNVELDAARDEMALVHLIRAVKTVGGPAEVGLMSELMKNRSRKIRSEAELAMKALEQGQHGAPVSGN